MREQMQNGTDWTTRTKTQQYRTPSSGLEGNPHRQQFHNSRTSMGAAGHWVHMAGLFAPVVIGEVIKDADKRWRYVRLASVGTALAYEGLYTIREQKRRAELEAERDRCCEHSH